MQVFFSEKITGGKFTQINEIRPVQAKFKSLHAGYSDRRFANKRNVVEMIS